MGVDYDHEALVYDESRGGEARARNAADAVGRLVEPPGLLVDVAGGTGIVGADLVAVGFRVLVVDLSVGMLRLAAARLPGRAVCGTATRLPLGDASVDVVTSIWLLHLLEVPVADAVVREAARVLRPGGCWVTTVDKVQAHGRPGAPADDRGRVLARAAATGLVPAGETSFTGSSAFGSSTDGDPRFPVVAFRRPSRTPEPPVVSRSRIAAVG